MTDFCSTRTPCCAFHNGLLYHLSKIYGKPVHVREGDVMRIESRGVVARLDADGDDVHPGPLQLFDGFREMLIQLVRSPVRDDEHQVLPAAGVLPHPGGSLTDGHRIEVPGPGLDAPEGAPRREALLPVNLQLGYVPAFAVGIPAPVSVGVAVDIEVDGGEVPQPLHPGGSRLRGYAL